MSTVIENGRKEREQLAEMYRAKLRSLFEDWRIDRKESLKEEEKIVEELLDILKDTDKPFTAHQLSQVLGGKMSTMEIAGNLSMLAPWRGSYAHSRYGVVEDCRRRYETEVHSVEQKWALLDENGNPTGIVKTMDTGVNAYKLVRK